MAGVITTHEAVVATETVEFEPSLGTTRSGIFQAKNVSADGSEAVATIVLHGRLTDLHEWHTVKSFALTSADSSTAVTNAAAVTLFPLMKVVATETSGNVTMTASILI